ncbi:MAG: hypothetical protein WC310_03200 [Patescibacteria group bacterium]|jgi:hypothetical protein
MSQKEGKKDAAFAPITPEVVSQTPESLEQPLNPEDLASPETTTGVVTEGEPQTSTDGYPPLPGSGTVGKAADILATAKDETLENIEDILEDDLEQVYANLPEEKKQEFKIEGEKTAYAIRGVLSSVRIKARRIFRLIASWLKIVPGINKFFLEQEAKIKTDEILDLVDEEKKNKNIK